MTAPVDLLPRVPAGVAPFIREPTPPDRTRSAEALSFEPPDEIEARLALVPEPLEVPEELWKANEADIVAFLDHELSLAEGEREPLMRKFARWKIAYAAPKAEKPKHHPLWNSSNLIVPVIKEIVNTLASQIVQTTLTVKPRWVLKDLAAEWKPFINDTEAFLDIASDRDVKLDPVGITAIMEACKLGTSIIEVAHKVDIRSIYRYTADGRRAFKSDFIKRDGPLSLNVPLSRFWIRLFETDIQEARWCAKEVDLQWHQLREMQADGVISDLEALKRWVQDQTSDRVEATEQKVEMTEPASHDNFRLFEVWLSWDIDGDGKYEELRLLYHKEARLVVSRKFNPYWHAGRPFVKVVYFPKEYRFYGEGLAEMLEDLQDGVTAKNNVRADNAAMANLKMFLKRRMVKGLMPGDPLYMGKIIDVNDIWNDLREFQMAEIYPSTVTEESILRGYADRLAGQSDATAGVAMPVTRTTAAAQIALLQEQIKRIDLTVRNFRDGFAQVGALVVHLYFQFGTNGKAISWLGDRGRVVEAIFRLPRRVQEIGIAIRVNSPTSAQNRQVRRENSIALLNLLIQVHKELFPFVQALAPQSMATVAHSFVAAANRFLTDTLDAFETTDPEEILAGLITLQKVLPSPQDLGGMERTAREEETAALLQKLTDLESRLVQADTERREALLGDGRRRRQESRQREPEFRLGGPPEPEGDLLTP